MKPEKQTKDYFNFIECERYISNKLGYDLRDTLGKLKNNSDAEYRDWWHFILDNLNIHNGCFITIDRYLLDPDKPWQNEITQAFIDEFGDGTTYYVGW